MTCRSSFYRVVGREKKYPLDTRSLFCPLKHRLLKYYAIQTYVQEHSFHKQQPRRRKALRVQSCKQMLSKCALCTSKHVWKQIYLQWLGNYTGICARNCCIYYMLSVSLLLQLHSLLFFDRGANFASHFINLPFDRLFISLLQTASRKQAAYFHFRGILKTVKRAANYAALRKFQREYSSLMKNALVSSVHINKTSFLFPATSSFQLLLLGTQTGSNSKQVNVELIS